VQLGALSHQGLVRSNNEDHFLVARFGRTLHTVATNLPADPLGHGHEETGYGMLVADGMGGMVAGEVASRMAIEALVELVVNTPDWIFSTEERLADVVMHRMATRFRQINETLAHQSDSNPALRGMGTTLTLACTLGLHLVVCHIGDSRVYRFRQGALQQLTRDMTAAQEMVEAGALTRAAAATNRLRHFLTQYLGGWGKGIADVQYLVLEDGDQILLCTDGLTEMVQDTIIADTLHAQAPPQKTCQSLVDLALRGGGKDNVTVVLACYQVHADDK
jgi:protein phosphatase